MLTISNEIALLLMRAWVGALLLVVLAQESAWSAIRRRRGPTHQAVGGASLRKRVHINSLITQDGTVEVETGGTVSLAGDVAGAFALPTVLKWTPAKAQTEYNVSFDTLTRDADAAHFSDRVTLGVTHEFTGLGKVAMAAGPQLTLFTRGASGVRVGGVGLARSHFGGVDGGVTASYSGATHASDSNPSGLVDFGGGFGRQLSRLVTVHANYLYEKATGISPVHALYEGVEFQVTPRFALDVSVQQVGVGGEVTDYQLVAGLTMNLGRPGGWLLRRH